MHGKAVVKRGTVGFTGCHKQIKLVRIKWEEFKYEVN